MAKGKNAAAQSLAAQRWKRTSKQERSELARAMNKSRWDNATEEERAELGRRLAAARAKARKKKATVKGKK